MLSFSHDGRTTFAHIYPRHDNQDAVQQARRRPSAGIMTILTILTDALLLAILVRVLAAFLAIVHRHELMLARQQESADRRHCRNTTPLG